MRAVCQIQVVNSACNGILSLSFFWVQFIWLWDNLQLQLQHQLGQDCEQGGASLKASKSNVQGYCEVNRFLFQTGCQKSKTNVSFHFQNKEALFIDLLF